MSYTKVVSKKINTVISVEILEETYNHNKLSGPNIAF